MNRTCVRGDATEALVRSELVRRGLTVLEPIGSHHAFDLAVVVGPRSILRVQCKTARRRAGCLLFNSCSTDHGAGRQAYTDRADVFAVGDLEAREVYVVPVDLAGSRGTSLRLRPARNNQREGILFAADHSVDVWTAAFPSATVAEAAVA